MGLKSVAATFAVAACLLAPGTAKAEPRGVDWGNVLGQVDHFVRTGERQSTPAPILRAEKLSLNEGDPASQNLGNAWFGAEPKVTLVARDWASSTRLAGDHLNLVDTVRLAQSTRMIVGRARLNGARFTPFLQAGIGQWRVDRNYMPLTSSYIEVASQLGTGFEIHVNRRWQLAVEMSATTLIREHEIESVPQTVLWSTFVASSVQF